MTGRNILLISPEQWGSIFVSKHHYAVSLAEMGNNVCFLNPPSDEFSFKPSCSENLWIVDYPGFPKGLRFYPHFLQRYFLANTYKKIEAVARFKFDIIWSFDNSVFYDFSALPQRLIKISHIVDLNQDFQLAKAASTASLCLCTTELIKAKLIQYNRNTFKINHGVVMRDRIPKQIVQLPGKQTIKVLYVGNLSMQYLDWCKLLTLALANSKIDFVFLGPDGKSNLSIHKSSDLNKDKIKQLPNVYFLKAVPADEIMGYLQAADILLVAYQEKHYTDQANPHKIMEYLASGKPIVATWTEEYADMNLLYMAKGQEEYLYIFNEVIENLECYTSKEHVERRVSYAKNNSYEKQILRIGKLIVTTCKNI